MAGIVQVPTKISVENLCKHYVIIGGEVLKILDLITGGGGRSKVSKNDYVCFERSQTLNPCLVIISVATVE